MNAAKRAFVNPMVRGAIMAAQFAQEIGLPAGNYWEPGIARKLAAELEIYTTESVEKHWRTRLGLAQKVSAA